MSREDFRMLVAGQIFDSGNYAWGRAVHRITDNRETPVANSIKAAPAGPIREKVEIILRGIGVRRSKDEKVGLQPYNLLKTHLGPVLRGFHDRSSSGVAKCVSNKSILADGDERFRPDNEQDPLGSDAIQPIPQIREPMFEVGGKRCTGIGCAENFRQSHGGSYDLLDSVRVGGVGRNSQVAEGVHRFEPIQALGDEDQVRPQTDNLLDAWIDGAPYFRFFLCIGRVIAIVSVAD